MLYDTTYFIRSIQYVWNSNRNVGCGIEIASKALMHTDGTTPINSTADYPIIFSRNSQTLFPVLSGGQSLSAVVGILFIRKIKNGVAAFFCCFVDQFLCGRICRLLNKYLSVLVRPIEFLLRKYWKLVFLASELYSRTLLQDLYRVVV